MSHHEKAAAFITRGDMGIPSVPGARERRETRGQLQRQKCMKLGGSPKLSAGERGTRRDLSRPSHNTTLLTLLLVAGVKCDWSPHLPAHTELGTDRGHDQ